MKVLLRRIFGNNNKKSTTIILSQKISNRARLKQKQFFLVLFVILKCNSLSFLINQYFHTFNWHLQVLIMKRNSVMTHFVRSFFPDSRLVSLNSGVIITVTNLGRHQEGRPSPSLPFSLGHANLLRCRDRRCRTCVHPCIHLTRAGEPEPEPEPVVFGSFEPLEKKTRSRSRLEKKSGAGAAKKLAGSTALLEDKKHKEIILLLLFFR